MKTTKTLKSNKKNAWFVRVRGSYLPNNAKGWLTYVPYLCYLLYTLYAGYKFTNSGELAVLYIVPNFVTAAVVMTFVASKKS